MAADDDSPSRWEVAQVRKETVEVTNAGMPQVRFVVQAGKASLRLEAWENGELEEQTLIARAVNDFIFEASDRSGSRMRLAMNAAEDKIISHVIVDDDEVVVGSAPVEHPFRVVAELRTRQLPADRLTRQFAEAVREDEKLRRSLQVYTRFGNQVLRAEGISNGVIAACAATCILCSSGIYALCVACALCICMQFGCGQDETPPPLTVKAE